MGVASPVVAVSICLRPVPNTSSVQRVARTYLGSETGQKKPRLDGSRFPCGGPNFTRSFSRGRRSERIRRAGRPSRAVGAARTQTFTFRVSTPAARDCKRQVKADQETSTVFAGIFSNFSRSCPIGSSPQVREPSPSSVVNRVYRSTPMLKLTRFAKVPHFPGLNFLTVIYMKVELCWRPQPFSDAADFARRCILPPNS